MSSKKTRAITPVQHQIQYLPPSTFSYPQVRNLNQNDHFKYDKKIIGLHLTYFAIIGVSPNLFSKAFPTLFLVKIRGLFCQLYSWQLHILYYRFYQSIVRQQYGKLGDLLFRRKLLNKKVWKVESSSVYSKVKTPIKPAYKA